MIESSYFRKGFVFLLFLSHYLVLVSLVLWGIVSPCSETASAQTLPLIIDSLPRIELRSNAVQKSITTFDFWIDPSHSYTIDSILKHKELPFERSQGDILSLDYRDATIWTRFVVRYYETPAMVNDTARQKEDRNTSALPVEPFILNTISRQADTAILFCINPLSGSIISADTSGYSIPYTKWKLQTSFIGFILPDLDNYPLLSLESSTRYSSPQPKNYREIICYQQFSIRSQTFISLRALDYQNHLKQRENFRTRFLLWLGVAIFACCYNLILFFVVRSRFYLFYVASILAYTLYRAVDAGHAYTFWEISPSINAHLLFISGLAYNAISALFVRAFWVERQEYVPALLDQLMVGYITLNIAAIAAELIGFRYIAHVVMLYSFIALGAPIMIIGTLIIWRKGYSPALYLFIARSFMEMGILINYVVTFKGKFYSILLGQIAGYAMYVAPFIEIILFSFALAARFTVLQQEKQNAEREALKGELYRRENEVLYTANLEITRQQNEIVELNTSLQYQNEKLAEANQEKDEIMGIVSHDLKNPIGAVRSYAELIQTGIFTGDEVPGVAGNIMHVSDKMLELVKNLLNINQLESGGIQLNMVRFDVVPSVEAAVYQYRLPAEAKNITLHFSNEATESVVSADEQALMQVLDNLVSNAVKYSPLGKQIFVRILSNTGNIRVEVQDEGPGISPDDMQKLFGKFARLTAQPTGGEHSTGLGLSIVKKMVEAMNGKVWCESEVGKGATFIVELPVT